MRRPFYNPKAGLLKYSIREIVEVAQKIKSLDPEFQFIGENIGDPVAKGWPVPPFVKQVVTDEVNNPNNQAFGYSHSRGTPDVRQWAAELSRKLCSRSKLDAENVLITNGLGAAISSLYTMFPPGTRIVQPTPTYPAHASMESFSAKAEPILYRLNPNHGWEPDLDSLEQQIKKNPEIAGILLINPNNPTGVVYPGDTLEKVVRLAEQYNLIVISDEIYFRMVYNGHTFSHITDAAAGRIPLVVMRGVSKDVPWPGGRCGWIEFHNVDLDEDYARYVESVKQRVLLEVSAVSLTQRVVPKIYDHPEFPEWNRTYNLELEKNGNFIADTLNQVKGLRVNRPNAAFYLMTRFDEGVLNQSQKLAIRNESVRAFIEQEVAKPDTAPDKRFTYYLLAATGICVVPASGFFSPYPGFRITTLERDEARRRDVYTRLTEAIYTYVGSQ